MCCLFTVLVFLGPRFGAVLWWLIQPARWDAAFNSVLWPILGIIFMPWTTLMYVAVAPGGVNGLWEWLFVILAVILDIGAYTGGGIGNKNKIPGMA
jgi:CDP-diglyceride synthetase